MPGRDRAGMLCRWRSRRVREARAFARENLRRRVVADVAVMAGPGGVACFMMRWAHWSSDVALLELIARRRRLKGRGGNVVALAGPWYCATCRGRRPPAWRAGQSSSNGIPPSDTANACIEAVPAAALGHQPRAGAGRFLTEQGFPYTPPLAGRWNTSRGRRALEPGGRPRLAPQARKRLGLYLARAGPLLRAGALLAGEGQEAYAARASRSIQLARQEFPPRCRN